MKRIRFFLSIILLSGLCSPWANAGFLTFEYPSGHFLSNSTITEGGYSITHGNTSALLGAFSMIHNSNDHSGNGSNVAYAYNQSSLSVARTDGTGFSLNSFDAGETLLSPTTAWADQVKLTGYDALGAVVIQALFTLDHIASPISGLQTFTTSGFTNLARIEFAGVCLSGSCNNREFSIDNLALIPSPVPEPVTLALLITGITFWQVRKRQFK